jgi:hypothetical protein
MSRRLPPQGLPYRRGQQDEEEVKHRIHIGQIITVDTLNGRVTVRSATTNEEWTLQIPLYGFSINGIKSSWIRYMPQRGDYVKIGFGPDNSPEILAYAAFGEELDPGDDERRAGGKNVPPRQGAYATIRRQAKAGTNNLGNIFRELREGEWDMRSYGGAEVFASRNGTLTLAGGGGASIRLIKERGEICSRTSLNVYSNDGVEVRFGNVRRKLLPTDTSESDVTTNPSGAAGAKEWKVRVAFKTPPLGTPELALYEHIYGDVRDGSGFPELLSGAPLRSRSTWSDAGGISDTLSVKVDAFGNVEVQQGIFALTSGVTVNGGGTGAARLTSLTTSFLNTDINSTVNGTMDSTLVSAIKGGVQTYLDAPLVNLGSQFAIQPVIKGLQFSTSAVAPYVAVEATYIGLLTAAFTALGPLLTKLGAVPPADAPALAAIAAAAGGGAAMIAGGAAYAAATASSLSLTVFTD